jgi:4-carboxymuconolactone decarboxylase
MRFAPIRPEQLTEEQRSLYDAVNGAPRGPVHLAPDGTLRGPFNALLYNPRLGSALLRVGAVLRYEGALPPRAREIAVLTVAAAYRSEYEWYQHAPEARRHGVGDEQLEAIRAGGPVTFDDDVDRCASELARRALDGADLDDETYERAVRLLGEAGLVELTALVGYYGILAYQMAVLRVPPPSDAPLAFVD